jgi:hypothetical protein
MDSSKNDSSSSLKWKMGINGTKRESLLLGDHEGTKFNSRSNKERNAFASS